MIKIRPRCPVCGTRLNESALDREVDLNDGEDILEQDIGGRGHVSTVNSYGFASSPEIAEYFLENVEAAKEYLEDILEVEDSDLPDNDEDNTS